MQFSTPECKSAPLSYSTFQKSKNLENLVRTDHPLWASETKERPDYAETKVHGTQRISQLGGKAVSSGIISFKAERNNASPT